MIIAWTSLYCAFAVKTSFKTDESVIAVKRVFCIDIILHWNDAILDRKSEFINAGSSNKWKQSGRPWSSQTSGNI